MDATEVVFGLGELIHACGGLKELGVLARRRGEFYSDALPGRVQLGQVGHLPGAVRFLRPGMTSEPLV